MAKVNPFDPKAVCPKCGCEDVATRHVPGKATEYASRCFCDETQKPYVDRENRWRGTAEHLERRCSRCGYLWPEATLDAKQGEPVAPGSRSVGSLRREPSQSLTRRDPTFSDLGSHPV